MIVMTVDDCDSYDGGRCAHDSEDDNFDDNAAWYGFGDDKKCDSD